MCIIIITSHCYKLPFSLLFLFYHKVSIVGVEAVRYATFHYSRFTVWLYGWLSRHTIIMAHNKWELIKNSANYFFSSVYYTIAAVSLHSLNLSIYQTINTFMTRRHRKQQVALPALLVLISHGLHVRLLDCLTRLLCKSENVKWRKLG